MDGAKKLCDVLFLFDAQCSALCFLLWVHYRQAKAEACVACRFSQGIPLFVSTGNDVYSGKNGQAHKLLHFVQSENKRL